MCRAFSLSMVLLLLACSSEPAPESAAQPEPPTQLGDPEELRLQFSYADSAALAESRRIQPLSPHVQRDGPVLRLLVGDGQRLSFRDQAVEGDDYRRFRFHDVLEGGGHYLVETHYYEGGDYMAVNRSTGKLTYLDDLPSIAPDRRRLVTTNLDLEAEYTPTRIQIYQIGADSLALEWEHEPTEPRWGPSDAQWLDAHTLRIIKNVPDYSEGITYHQRPMTLRYLEGRWTIVADEEISSDSL